MTATRRVALATLIAIALALVPGAASAAENRPETPVIASPSAEHVMAVAADLVVSGTGTPGDIVYVSRFASEADYASAVARDEKAYQDFESGTPLGGFGGPGTTVAPDGTWSMTESSAELAESAKDGAVYLAASAATLDRTSPQEYPLSTYSPSVRVALAWLSTPTEAPVTGSRPTTSTSPSVFSALEAFNWRTFTPAHVAVTAGAALVLALLVGLPTALLEKALETTHEKRERRFTKLRKRLTARLTARRAVRSRARRKVPPALLVAIWFVVAGIIAGFADAAFGFNLMSLRVLLTLVASFALLNVLGAYVTWWFTARSSGTKRPKFPLLPTNLLILVGTVLLARLIHLQPGLVLGSVLGLDFGIRLAANRKGRVVLVGAVYAAAIGILAWIAYSLVPEQPGDFWALLFREFFAQLAVAGISTLPVTLLPFRSLNGEALFLWRKLIWGLSYAVGLLFFFFVLLPMPFSWKAVSQPLVAWIGLFVLYAVIAILVWLAIRFKWFSRKKPRVASTG